MAEPTLFQSQLSVITAGIGGFTEALQRQSVPVVALDWRPPADGNEALAAILKTIYTDAALHEKIESANREVLRRITESVPQIVDVVSARDALGLEGQTITHAGPPIAWERMCGPQQRAVMGAIQFEGWAASNAAAAALVQSGAVRLVPNHAYNAVGPMTGVISPSMPVLVACNATFGAYSYSTFNEGRGNTLWFGLFDDGTLKRLQWIRDTLAPAVKAALGKHGPLNVFDIVAQGLQMGDECHARSAACTALLVKRLTAPMLEAGVAPNAVAEFVRFADGNNHFFLTWTMAAVKCVMDAAHGVPHSTVVTAMSRNGVDFMLRVSGLGNEWLVAPVSPMDEAVYYTGFSLNDAAGDIGDSAIIETCGLGGMAIAGAPTVATFVGGSLADEVAAVEALNDITVGRHPKFSLPPMDGQNTPVGVDVRGVVETRTVPFITTGVLHETSPTVGQIGTGVARVPVGLFDAALIALAHTWGVATALPRPSNVVQIEPQ
ncbi:MAG: oxamate carbamoyltransferase subunit AllG family protein [Anaerolineales bacterium]